MTVNKFYLMVISRVFDTAWLRLFQFSVAGFVGLVLTFSITYAPVFAEEEGCGCHSAESEAWQESPHSQVTMPNNDGQILTCEGCHGEYVRGHPDEGLMILAVDSEMCTECHSETSTQWSESKHAESGVQCIGCHLTHSQTLRLSEDTLCISCHRESPEDVLHISHQYSDVNCTNCHVNPSPESVMGISENCDTTIVMQTPTHDFTEVSATACTDCHAKQISGEESFVSGEENITELMMVANRVPDLSAKLKAAKEQNQVLSTVSFVALGLGVGIGALMGIILVLVVGHATQGNTDESFSEDR